MAEIVFRSAALRDLERIAHHIAAADPRAAARLRVTMFDRIALLRRVPESAQPRPEFGPDIRTLPVGRYVVVLRVHLPEVIVLRIIHGARDLPRIFKPEK